MTVLHSKATHSIGGSRGGVPGARPHKGPDSFVFDIQNFRNVTVSGVYAPLRGPRPPTGNPGSATAFIDLKLDDRLYIISFHRPASASSCILLQLKCATLLPQ